jgi:uncharacterized coiled-coil DUF342 family protein
MENTKKAYSDFDIELDSLAMERAKLNNELKEIKAKLDSVNNQIKEKLGSVEDYTTEYYHFIYKVIVTPEHMVKESISRPLKVN